MKSFARFALFILLPVLVVMLIAGVSYHFYGKSTAQKEAEDRLKSTARLIAELIQRHIIRIDSALSTALLQQSLDQYYMFHRVELFDEAEENRIALEDSLERLANSDSGYRQIEMYLASGERFVAIVDGKRRLKPINVSKESWFQKALLKERVVQLETDGVIRITRVRRNANGEIVAVGAVAHDCCDAFANAVHFAADHLKECHIAVVDNNGKVKFTSGKRFPKEAIEQTKPIPIVDATITVRQTTDRAFTAFHQGQWTLFLVLGFLTLSLMVIAALGTRKITQDLREAREKAEEASRAKSAFLATMSHEIRTPMNGMLGMLQLLSLSEMDQQQCEQVRVAVGSAEQLLHIINDILDFSKIEAGKLELESVPFNLHETIGSAVQSFAMLAAEKKLELALRIAPEVPDAIVGDQVRLRQVISNLVGNAIKFTAKGEVVVSISTKEEIDEKVTLHCAVRDTGIGIPPDKQEVIFHAFSQADISTTRQFGGTGLGLAISYRLVELFGGQLAVTSQEQHGSTFSFELTADRHETLSTPSTETTSLQDIPVLIVDDNATNQMILREMAEQMGMKPVVVESGPQALTYLEECLKSGKRIPLVLLDLHMPEMDGLQVAEQIHALTHEDRIQVILLPSADQLITRERLEKAGIDHCLCKPVVMVELRQTLLEVLTPPRPEKVLVKPKSEEPVNYAKQARILLAEDNGVNQKVALKFLQLRGHTVKVVENGAKAVEAFQNDDFDLILMDIEMPVMDGTTATRQIRQIEKDKGGHIPIIALTAHALTGHCEQFLAAGMDDYLAKPIKSGQLFEKLDRQLANSIDS